MMITGEVHRELHAVRQPRLRECIRRVASILTQENGELENEGYLTSIIKSSSVFSYPSDHKRDRYDAYEGYDGYSQRSYHREREREVVTKKR